MQAAPTNSLIPADARGVRRVEFRALGTNCLIQFRLTDEKKSLQFINSALAWLERFEAKYSRFQPTSVTSQINAAAGGDWVKIDPETEQLLDLAERLFRLTSGILDITMLPLLQVWNWKALKNELPATEKIEQARQLSGFSQLQRRPGGVRLPKSGMGIDFGGFGKEYAVDQLVAIAKHYEIQDAMIDLGRDLFGLGGNGLHPFWHVGIEDGCNPGHCWGGLAVSNYAVAASGDSMRHFEHNGIRYGHIIDPRTGWPVTHGVRAVTVLAPTCLLAGVYSTSLFILGLKEGLRFANCAKDLDACIQTDTGIEATKNFIKRQVKPA